MLNLKTTASVHIPRILLLSPQCCHGRRRMFDAEKDTAPDVGKDKASLGINHLRQPSQRPCTAAHTSTRLALGYEAEKSTKPIYKSILSWHVLLVDARRVTTSHLSPKHFMIRCLEHQTLNQKMKMFTVVITINAEAMTFTSRPPRPRYL
ncbi:hypothetical protein CEP53_012789 [Fusarium sp. AF-6]|nr:hypothetical protein CEP53_012789 [Fusarium sp. AF-6]